MPKTYSMCRWRPGVAGVRSQVASQKAAARKWSSSTYGGCRHIETSKIPMLTIQRQENQMNEIPKSTAHLLIPSKKTNKGRTCYNLVN
jgi:hypothetical protein